MEMKLYLQVTAHSKCLQDDYVSMLMWKKVLILVGRNKVITLPNTALPSKQSVVLSLLPRNRP